MQKTNILIDSEQYEKISKDPMTRTERKVQKCLTKNKPLFMSAQKCKLTPHYGSPPFIYGLPKIHKPHVLLWPIVNCVGSPCYAWAGFFTQHFESIGWWYWVGGEECTTF